MSYCPLIFFSGKPIVREFGENPPLDTFSLKVVGGTHSHLSLPCMVMPYLSLCNRNRPMLTID